MDSSLYVSFLAAAAAASLTGALATLATERAARRWRRLWPLARPAPRSAAAAGLLARWRARHQQRQVAGAVPALLDLLVLCADGGSNLHQALEVAAELVEGPLRDGLREACRELHAGVPLVQALEHLAGRWGGEEVNTLVRILRVGQALGTPVGDSLRQASRFLRERLRLQVEQRLAAVPLQMTLCTLAFFLPPTFVLLLLPNLMNFAGTGW